MPRRYDALVLGLLLPTLGLPSVATASVGAPSTGDEEPSATEITIALAEADALDRAGNASAAARRFAEAFWLTEQSPTLRGSPTALEAAASSARNFRLAFESTPDDVALLDESEAVLEAVVSRWTALGQPVPAAIRDGLTWIDQQRPPPVQIPTPTPTVEPELDPSDEDPATEPTETQKPPPIVIDPGPVQPVPDSGEERPTQTRLGIALTAIGVVVLGGGVAPIVIGAPVAAEARDHRRTTLASEQFSELGPSDQQVAREHLDRYVEDERSRGITSMALGGVAVGVGVTAVVVGAVLWHRGRSPGTERPTARLVPHLRLLRGRTASGASAGLTVAF